jgi:hypothetical protein
MEVSMDAKKTSKYKKYTIIMIVANVIIMAGYDVLALTEGGVDATISRVLYHGASDHPIIAVAFGVLVGHLFWPQRPEKRKEE